MRFGYGVSVKDFFGRTIVLIAKLKSIGLLGCFPLPGQVLDRRNSFPLAWSLPFQGLPVKHFDQASDRGIGSALSSRYIQYSI